MTGSNLQWNRRDFARLGAMGLLAGGMRASVAPRAAACILIWQEGGLSHLDTFDVKTAAPVEYRGEFGTVPTTIPGIRFSEHLARTARQAHLLTVLRSMQSDETNHERAAALLLGGLPAAVAPEGNLAGESPSLRDRYGHTAMAADCLRARRMVEAGARMVRVSHGSLLYDTHRGHFRAMRERVLPEFDRAFAALVEDLAERRMLDRTLVMAMGEFGRSPRINREGGRDHHARAWSVVLAGGGLPGGRALGATDRIGGEVIDLPVSPRDLVATVRAILGIEAPAGGRVVPEIIG